MNEQVLSNHGRLKPASSSQTQKHQPATRKTTGDTHDLCNVRICQSLTTPHWKRRTAQHSHNNSQTTALLVDDLQPIAKPFIFCRFGEMGRGAVIHPRAIDWHLFVPAWRPSQLVGKVCVCVCVFVCVCVCVFVFVFVCVCVSVYLLVFFG